MQHPVCGRTDDVEEGDQCHPRWPDAPVAVFDDAPDQGHEPEAICSHPDWEQEKFAGTDRRHVALLSQAAGTAGPILSQQLFAGLPAGADVERVSELE